MWDSVASGSESAGFWRTLQNKQKYALAAGPALHVDEVFLLLSLQFCLVLISSTGTTRSLRIPHVGPSSALFKNPSSLPHRTFSQFLSFLLSFSRVGTLCFFCFHCSSSGASMIWSLDVCVTGVAGGTSEWTCSLHLESRNPARSEKVLILMILLEPSRLGMSICWCGWLYFYFGHLKCMHC